MAREITAGVLLKLKDQFSSQIKNAGISVQGFADKAVGMAEKVNGAFSGVAGTLATLGVGVGTAALVKGAIDYQSAITRIATNAGVYDREVNEFGRLLLQISYDAKVPENELIAFANTASECAVGLADITENMPFMAKVVQGLGISGEEAGQLFTALFKRGADADTLKEKLNNLAEIGNRLGNMSITQFAKFLPSLSETSGVAVDNIEEVYIALNMLATGTNKPQQALQQYQSAMNDFAKADTRDAIRRGLGFDVLNEDTGELKSFAEIMEALSVFGEKSGATAYFDKAFHLSDSTIKALRQYNNHYKETVRTVGELGDTSNAIAKRADQNAGTIEGSLTRLKTAAKAFADSTLIKPVEKLAKLLNENPEGMKKAVYGLAAAVAGLALLKGFTTVVSFIGSLKELKGGGGAGIPGGLAGGGAGIPVHVTNWGGAAGASGLPGMEKILSDKPAGSLLEPAKKAFPAIGAKIASVALPLATAAGLVFAGMKMNEIYANDERRQEFENSFDYMPAFNVSDQEYDRRISLGWSKKEAAEGKKREAVDAGSAAVSPGIAPEKAGGYKASRSRRPIQVNDLIVTPQGQFSTHPDDFIFAMKNPSSLVNNEIKKEIHTVENVPQAKAPVIVEGEIELKSELVIDDKGYRLRQRVGKNTTPYKFSVGSAANARLIQ